MNLVPYVLMYAETRAPGYAIFMGGVTAAPGNAITNLIQTYNYADGTTSAPSSSLSNGYSGGSFGNATVGMYVLNYNGSAYVSTTYSVTFFNLTFSAGVSVNQSAQYSAAFGNASYGVVLPAGTNASIYTYSTATWATTASLLTALYTVTGAPLKSGSNASYGICQVVYNTSTAYYLYSFKYATSTSATMASLGASTSNPAYSYANWTVGNFGNTLFGVWYNSFSAQAQSFSLTSLNTNTITSGPTCSMTAACAFTGATSDPYRAVITGGASSSSPVNLLNTYTYATGVMAQATNLYTGANANLPTIEVKEPTGLSSVPGGFYS